MMTFEQLAIEISKTFLTEPLPDDFIEMDEADLLDFVEDHAWQPFEEWTGDDLMHQIEETTMGVFDLMMRSAVTCH